MPFLITVDAINNYALFHKELWDWLLKMGGEEDSLGKLMKSELKEVNDRFKSVESSEIEKTFRDKKLHL